jgi:hypothetical protein
MNRNRADEMTIEEIDELAASMPEQYLCWDCKGHSQDSDDAPHCDTCEDYGYISNLLHPSNWE